MMDADVLLMAGGIFLLRVIGNMITTIRLVLIVRGQKLSSSFLSIFETLIFAVSLGSVVSHLGNLWNLSAYCMGFAVGGYLGLVLEQRLIQRFISIHIISPRHAHDIAQTVRAAGYGATESWGQGAEGRVGSVTAVVGHQEVDAVLKIVREVDPQAFVMTDELRAISQGYFRRMIRPER
jgi:uncharacterized protein YebE (UPF0316 family)